MLFAINLYSTILVIIYKYLKIEFA